MEMAKIRYKISRHQLEIARQTVLDIEGLLDMARQNLCEKLGNYSAAEKAYKKAGEEYWSNMEKINFELWYENANTEDIATAMRHNKGQLEYLRKKYRV